MCVSAILLVKDLGKKWFAFSKLDNKMLEFVLGRLIENQA